MIQRAAHVTGLGLGCHLTFNPFRDGIHRYTAVLYRAPLWFLWFGVSVALTFYLCVALCLCVSVAFALCGTVALWLCGCLSVALWLFGFVDL